MKAHKRASATFVVANFLLNTAACVLFLACSDAHDPLDTSRPGTSEPNRDSLFVPEGLTVSAALGGNGTFKVSALTLARGSSGGELYAAVRNDGDRPGCSPAFSVELFDGTGQMLAAGVSGLLVRRFYRVADGSGTIAACVAPGETSIVAIKDFPSDLVVEDAVHVNYRLNYWALDVVPIDGVNITAVRAIARGTGVAFAGTLSNDFDVSMSSPSVAVFPLNRLGRPLGAAFSSSATELLPGGNWDFETSTISDPGAAQAAYPTGGP